MIAFTEWVAQLPAAEKLYPSFSHEWLIVSRWSGYNPSMPFVSAGVGTDGLFKFTLSPGTGKRRASKVCSSEEAREVFQEFLVVYGIREQGTRSRKQPRNIKGE